MVEQFPDPKRHCQRIYVGGMNPSRGLGVADVWQRLEAKLSNPGDGVPKFQWSDVYRGSCYLQFTVSHDVTTEPSPLAIVKSWFHNVMWKGCKLVVDEARPHFLQRLQEERNSRQEVSLDSNATEISDSQDPINSSEPQPLSRYWRVRRGYCGEPIRHVDTQSCDVTSWSMFSRIRQRHCKQQEKDRIRRIELLKSGTNMTVKEAQKRAYYNRSIRLKFTDDIVGSAREGDHALSLDAVSSSEQSLDNPDDNASNESLEYSDKIQNDAEKYVWSDDDTSSEESDTNQDDIPASVKPTVSPNNNKTAEMGTYIWSDDDDSSDVDVSNNLKKRKFSTHRDLDEFESALDLTHVNGQNADEVTDKDNSSHPIDNDITKDVERNLSILAKLFPDTSRVPPNPHKAESMEDDQQPKIALSEPLTLSGWSASGQMLRFDPSRPQSNSLLLNDDVSNIVGDPENVIDKSDSAPVTTEIDAANLVEHKFIEQSQIHEEPDATTTKGVYEQKKLEQVFKEAREGIPIVSTDQTDAGAPFAFGFEVDDSEIPNEAPSSLFSFNFGIGETSQALVGDGTVNEVGNTAQDVESNNPVYPRFPAFEYPNESMLNEMVHSFYKMNDGERIMNDVDEWRNDPSVKDKWLKERLALTQDWKRKKKFALSKQQKRNQKG